jgi:hypothetical protein
METQQQQQPLVSPARSRRSSQQPSESGEFLGEEEQPFGGTKRKVSSSSATSGGPTKKRSLSVGSKISAPDSSITVATAAPLPGHTQVIQVAQPQVYEQQAAKRSRKSVSNISPVKYNEDDEEEELLDEEGYPIDFEEQAYRQMTEEERIAARQPNTAMLYSSDPKERRRERNRLAAQRSRERKMRLIDKLKLENKEMKVRIQYLEQENKDLKKQFGIRG